MEACLTLGTCFFGVLTTAVEDLSVLVTVALAGVSSSAERSVLCMTRPTKLGVKLLVKGGPFDVNAGP